ncbi:MAG: heme exporter protein CcmB [Gammaproteobacteria bacterium]
MTLSEHDPIFPAIIKRDILLLLRRRVELVNCLVFFLLTVTLFTIAVGPGQTLLRQIAPGILWVAALLSSTLTLDMIFREDFEDGCLEQFLLSDHSLTLIIAAKLLAHWLISGVPLLLITLLMSIFLYLDRPYLPPLLLTLLLGTPVFSLLGGMLAALTVGLRNGGALLALLILPLYIPILIFATGAVQNAVKGLSITGEIYFLAALLVLALTLAPVTTAAAIKVRLG